MGYLAYGATQERIPMDDRVLAHLRAVILAKFRRKEPFALNVEFDRQSGSGYATLWLSPTIDLAFMFEGSRRPALNRAWIEELMQAANGPDGVHLTHEPDGTERADRAGRDVIQIQRG